MPTDGERRLRGAPQTQIALFLPEPISGRLDALIAVMQNAGERTSRRELVAALLLRAEPSAMLRRWTSNYREALVGDALVEGQPESFVLCPRRRPGPRQLEPPTGAEPWESAYDAEEPLEDLERYRVGLRFPRPLRDRLESITALIQEKDPEIDRDEVVAALILHAPESLRSLRNRIARYRRAGEEEAGRRLTTAPLDRRRRRRPDSPRRYRRR